MNLARRAWDRLRSLARPRAAPPAARRERPRIVLLADRPGWAFDHSARAVARALPSAWDVDLLYVVDRPRLEPASYDLLFVYFWGETWHLRFGCDPERVIKQVSSHRWEDDPAYGPCAPADLVRRHLHDAATITCTSWRLHELVRGHHPRAFHAPNGVDAARFSSSAERAGEMVIGWAGNAEDPVKRFHEVLVPAAAGYRLERATTATHGEMPGFYNRVDVFVACSRHEGEPLTLIEAMACGCFPVCADIGIVPELVRHGENGLIVRDPTPAGFRAAFAWCAANLERVREAGRRNAEEIGRARGWTGLAPRFAAILGETLERAWLPRFRNDDVSWDTDLDRFREFCGVFSRRGLRQLHGVTLNGSTATRHRDAAGPVEYPGEPNLSRMANARIRDLAAGQPFSARRDLIELLAASGDELALHGLFHTDHARMSYDEQRRDLGDALGEMRALFPGKAIRYFIPPFNRANRHTHVVCGELGLHVLAADGVHLEAELERLDLRPGAWHRYHHHRFYPESTFDHYPLSLDRLERALDRRPLASAATGAGRA